MIKSHKSPSGTETNNFAKIQGYDLKKLDKEFFYCDSTQLAKKLLGKILCVQTSNEVIRKIITETESYELNDTACHAYKGRTKRTDPLFCRGGTAYVYLCYGIHEIFNISAGSEGEGQGVMIRGVYDAENFVCETIKSSKIIGPGKAAKSFYIDRSFNYEFLPTSTRVWLEDAPEIPPEKIHSLKRVGIGYASKADQDKLLRFKILSNEKK